MRRLKAKIAKRFSGDFAFRPRLHFLICRFALAEVLDFSRLFLLSKSCFDVRLVWRSRGPRKNEHSEFLWGTHSDATCIYTKRTSHKHDVAYL